MQCPWWSGAILSASGDCGLYIYHPIKFATRDAHIGGTDDCSRDGGGIMGQESS